MRSFALALLLCVFAAACGGGSKGKPTSLAATPSPAASVAADQATANPAAVPATTAIPGGTKGKPATVTGRKPGAAANIPVPTPGTIAGFKYTPANVYSGSANNVSIHAYCGLFIRIGSLR